jgi:hypothetical protein
MRRGQDPTGIDAFRRGAIAQANCLLRAFVAASSTNLSGVVSDS